jgi:POT family proton-dependent oligopeptide transporter
MWRAAETTPLTEKATPLALVACYAVLTLGELCLSPMGLSLVSKLAPPHARAMWMGLFFVSISAGGFLAGQAYQVLKGWLSIAQFFLFLAGSSAFAMLLMTAAYPLIAAALRPAPADEPAAS